MLEIRSVERAARPSSRLVAASCTSASVAAWLEKAAGREADHEAAAVLQVGLAEAADWLSLESFLFGSSLESVFSYVSLGAC